ncbi:MAG: tRNA lysidine(34) synthetase TilS [Gammaproteobacteria bacterium]|nr:tRNA lysidine(34) synthetase TilS [Gammaproteobacteria bacterium]
MTTELIHTKVEAALQDLRPGTLWVAYSGGRDSHVLLHAICAIRRARQSPISALPFPWSIRAVHVNHGLHEQSPVWARHCVDVCTELEVPITIEQVTVASHGHGVEAAARDARYTIFERLVRGGETLLMAHHQDDQVETVLLRLFRGSGLDGIGAMRARRKLGQGWLARPFLDVGRKYLDAYATAAGLVWCEDPSNGQVRYDRNYLRHEIMPAIEARWPGAPEAIARTSWLSQLLADQHTAQARADFELVQGQSEGTLSVTGLSQLGLARAYAVLRYWVSDCGGDGPSLVHLQQLMSQAVESRWDRMPVVGWSNTEVRRYRDELYLCTDTSSEGGWHAPRTWRLAEAVTLGHGVLTATPEIGRGFADACCVDSRGARAVRIRRRRGGEKIRLQAYGSKRLKVLFQERAVPPWQREVWPLVFVGDELAAVPGLCVAEKFATPPGMPGWSLNWNVSDHRRVTTTPP